MQKYFYDVCKKHMNQHVLLHTTTGEQIGGVITNIDEQNVYLTVPARPDEISDQDRQYNPYGGGPQHPPRPRPPYGPGGNPYHPGPGPGPGPRPRPPYGGYPPYYPGYPPYNPGPQPGSPNQLIIPLAALAAISLLPFI